jgi:hypothetical protein
MIGFQANFVSNANSARKTANDQTARSVWNHAGLSKASCVVPAGAAWPISGPWPWSPLATAFSG